MRQKDGLYRRFFTPIKRLLNRLLRRPEPPPDPYARVRVPRKPVLPQRSAAVALEEPD